MLTTVVIVVIALAVSIAGEYWIVGAIPAFTQYEELKTVSVYISDSENATINVKNTGSGEASITDIFVNGRDSMKVAGPQLQRCLNLVMKQR